MFEPGWVVGLVLAKRASSCRAMVGEVQRVDERGIRITPLDWLTGSFTQMDVWYPWPAVLSATVQTDQHMPEQGYWNRWQEQTTKWLDGETELPPIQLAPIPGNGNAEARQ